MEPKRNEILEKILHRELQKLPDSEAPATLIPDVVAAIALRANAAWWHRSWSTWPAQIRAISLLAGMLCVIVFLYGSDWVFRNVEAAVSAYDLAGYWTELLSIGGTFETLGRALILALQSMGQPWLLVVVSVVLLMYVACVALGSATLQVVSNKR